MTEAWFTVLVATIIAIVVVAAIVCYVVLKPADVGDATTRPTLPKVDVAVCDHCGAAREPNDFAMWSVDGDDDLLCHPVSGDAPSCYELVTVFGETVGDRQAGRAMRGAPLPWEAGYNGFAAAAAAEAHGDVVLPAVFGILADHCSVTTPSGRVWCTDAKGVSHGNFADQEQWRRHVGPLLASTLVECPSSSGRS